MPTTIDSLDIQISTTLKQSDEALDNLIKKLNTVQTSLSSIGGKSLRSFNSGLNKTNSVISKTTKNTKSLASAFGKFYASYFLVIRGIKSLYNSIENTADYIEAFNYYNVAFGKIASEWSGEWEKYGYENAEAYSDSFVQRMNETLSKLSGVQVQIGEDGKGLLTEKGFKNLGLNIREVTQYASQMASVSDSVGMTAESSLALAKTMSMLAGDVNSLFNIDYSSVATNIQAVLQGQSRAGYKYGWDTTLATLQKYADELNLSKPVSEMTQLEKRYLRVLAVLDQSKVSWGDLANTIASPSNMIRQLVNNLEETGIILGQLFIPMLEKVLPVLNGVTIAIKRLLVNIAGFLSLEIDFSSFGQGYSDTEDALEGIADGYDAVADAANKAAKGTRKFDELNVISLGNASEKNNTSGAAGTIDLTEEILKATAEYEKVWNEAYSKMENRAAEFADKIEKSLEPLKSLFENLSLGNFNLAGQDVSTIILGITGMINNAIENVDWQAVGNNIGEFLSGIEWSAVFEDIGDIIFSTLEGALEAWQGAFDAAPIETVLLTAIAGLHFSGLGQLIVAKLSNAIISNMTIGNFFNTLLAGFKTLLGSTAAESALVFVSKFVKGFTGIASIISGAVLSVKNFFDMWENGWNLLDEVLKDIGIALAAVGAVILGVSAAPAAIVAAIVAAASSIVIVVHDNWEQVTAFFLSAWEKIKEVWENVSNWFDQNVITPIVNFFTPIGKTISDVFEGAWIVIKAVWKVVGDWFNETVIGPIKNIFSPLGTIISEKINNAWNSIKKVWGFASSWINNMVIVPIGKLFDTLWSGLKKGVASAMNGIIKTVENMLNFFISGINKVLTGFNEVVNWAADIIGANWDGITLIPTVTLPKIPVYSVGGFPEDGLFMANSTELVGQFSNGRTAVANNEQITKGIADAVYPAVYNAMSTVIDKFGGQEIRVFIGDREITDVAIDGISARIKKDKKMPFPLLI